MRMHHVQKVKPPPRHHTNDIGNDISKTIELSLQMPLNCPFAG